MTSLSRSLRRAWCCVIVLPVLAKCLSFAGDPHPSLPPPVIPECFGVNIHFTDPKPGEMEMLAAAGFRWVRMDFTWAGTEREKGVYDFSAYDRLVAHLDKHKLRALFILDYGNKLYDPDGASSHTDESRVAFARWAAAAVAHFKGKGYLWELWNEPKIAQFWKPKPNVDDYIALAKATADALRDARLIAGRDGSPSRPPDAGAAKESSKDKPATDGSASRPYHECLIGPAVSTIDLTFLEACFKAGLLDVWDAVSVHPYRQSAPETVEEEYRSVRQLIRKYAPKDKSIPIISSEWGYSSAWKDCDEEKRAKYLPRQFLTNIANDVALSIWYDWHDDGPDPKEPEHHFGLVRHEYREGKDPVFDPKPAYQAVKTMTGQLGEFRFSKRILGCYDLSALGNEFADRHLLFAREKENRLVAWSMNPGEQVVFLPSTAKEFISVSNSGVESQVPPQVGETVVADGTKLTVGTMGILHKSEPVYYRPRDTDEIAPRIDGKIAFRLAPLARRLGEVVWNCPRLVARLVEEAKNARPDALDFIAVLAELRRVRPAEAVIPCPRVAELAQLATFFASKGEPGVWGQETIVALLTLSTFPELRMTSLDVTSSGGGGETSGLGGGRSSEKERAPRK